jgi:hypothetical protein
MTLDVTELDVTELDVTESLAFLKLFAGRLRRPGRLVELEL